MNKVASGDESAEGICHASLRTKAWIPPRNQHQIRWVCFQLLILECGKRSQETSGANCLARLAVLRTLSSVRDPPSVYWVSDQEKQPMSTLGLHTCTCEHVSSTHVSMHCMHRRHTHGKSTSFIQQELAFWFLIIYLSIMCVYIHMCMPWHTDGDQDGAPGSPFSPFTIWARGTELRWG